MYVLSENLNKNQKKFPVKFSIFSSKEFLCILHGQVFVMRNEKEHFKWIGLKDYLVFLSV